MQFNFWRFTSDIGTNILIAAAVWFILSVICNKTCGKKDRITSLAVYIGYAIASFGMGLYSVLGIYSGIAAIGFIVVGIIVVIAIGSMAEPVYTGTKSSFAGNPFAGEREIPSETCPYCGMDIQITGGIQRPDKSIVCPKCYKNFTP